MDVRVLCEAGRREQPTYMDVRVLCEAGRREQPMYMDVQVSCAPLGHNNIPGFHNLLKMIKLNNKASLSFL